MPDSLQKLKMVQHSPAFVEFCEACGSTQENVRDMELQSATGRQLARVFLCKPHREEAAALFATEAAKDREEVALPGGHKHD